MSIVSLQDLKCVIIVLEFFLFVLFDFFKDRVSLFNSLGSSGNAM